jgi:YD repeat-containing protein
LHFSQFIKGLQATFIAAPTVIARCGNFVAAKAAGSLSRSYDEFGNLLTNARTTSAGTLTTSYTYDAANRIASITYPSQTVVSYTRDIMGRITAVTAKPNGGASTPVVLYL